MIVQTRFAHPKQLDQALAPCKTCCARPCERGTQTVPGTANLDNIAALVHESPRGLTNRTKRDGKIAFLGTLDLKKLATVSNCPACPFLTFSR